MYINTYFNLSKHTKVIYIFFKRHACNDETCKIPFSFQIFFFFNSQKLGFSPFLVIVIECTKGFGTGGVGPVYRPTAQHIVSMAPVPPD